MNKAETDISLIRKYLNGELDARAMHQLEKRAQADPFLMDAMEGYQSKDSNQQENLDELANRIKQRVTRKEARIIPWKFIAAAASVLVVLTIGGLWVFNNRPAQKTMVANVIVKPVARESTDSVHEQPNYQKRNDIAALKAGPKAKSSQKLVRPVVKPDMAVKDIALEEPVMANSDVLKKEVAVTDTKFKDEVFKDKDTTPLNETVVIGYSTQKNKDINGAVSSPTAKSIQPAPTQSLDQALQGRVAGVTVTQNDGSPGAQYEILIRGSALATNPKPLYVLDGVPVNGIPSINPGDIKSINVLKDDKVTAIYGSRGSNGVVLITTIQGSTTKADSSARPLPGWDSLNAYLKEKAISPDGQTGVVKLSFQVDRHGFISNLKVVKGVSKETDQKAIDLINNGPQWLGAINGQKATVNVEVTFFK